MTTIANLRAVMTMDAKGFERGTSVVTRGLGAMRTGIGALIGGVGAYGFAGLVRGALDSADKIQKLRDRLGLTAPFLSVMAQATQMAGTNLEAFSTAIVSLNRNTQAAVRGSKEMQQAFFGLGLEAKRFDRFGPEMQFALIAEAISRAEDKAVALDAATRIMGEGAVQLMPLLEGGAAGIAQAWETARESNQIMSDQMVDDAARANDAWKKLTDTLAGSFRNAVLENAEGLTGLITLGQEAIGGLGMILNPLGSALGRAVPVARDVVGAGLATVTGQASEYAPNTPELQALVDAFDRAVSQAGNGATFARDPQTGQVLKEQNDLLARILSALQGAFSARAG